MMTPVSLKLAKKSFVLALEKRMFFVDFKDKLMIMLGHIKRIQQKFIDRTIYREAKIEMLKLYWTQTLAWFVSKSC